MILIIIKLLMVNVLKKLVVGIFIMAAMTLAHTHKEAVLLLSSPEEKPVL
jgi:hypothetical protein